MASSASATVLVTGASGLLGRQMMAAFNLAGSFFVLGQGLTRATPPTVLQADLAQPEQIERLLDESRAGIIIHCMLSGQCISIYLSIYLYTYIYIYISTVSRAN